MLVIAILVGIGLTVACWEITRDRWIGGLFATTLVPAAVSIIPFFAWQALASTFGPTVALAAFGLALFAVIALPAMQRVRARQGAALIRVSATRVLNRFAAILVVVALVFHAGPDVPGGRSRARRGSRIPSSW